MANVDYYLFTMSPFNYLAGQRLEEIAAKHGATITYKPFGLIKVFEQTGGTPLAQRHESRQNYRAQDLARIALHNDMPFNLKPAHWPTNPVPSCAAIISAQATGGGDLGGLCFALLRACWAEEKNIAEDAAVKDCLAKHGYDPAILDTGLLNAVETYERNTNDAIEANVFGAPSYVVGDQVFWGQDRLAYLDSHLQG